MSADVRKVVRRHCRRITPRDSTHVCRAPQGWSSSVQTDAAVHNDGQASSSSDHVYILIKCVCCVRVYPVPYTPYAAPGAENMARNSLFTAESE